MGIRDRLTREHQSSDQQQTDSPDTLTPMMRAFLDAVNALSELAPSQVGMVVAGLTKHLARNPMPDTELVQALSFAKALIDGVLDAGGTDLPIIEVGDVPSTLALVPPVFVPVDETAITDVQAVQDVQDDGLLGGTTVSA